MQTSRRSFLSFASAGLAVPVLANTDLFSSAAGEEAMLPALAADEKVMVLGGDYFLDHRLSNTKNINPDVFDLFRKADFSFANLECGLSISGSADLGGFTHGPALRGDPALVSELGWAGIKSVSVSNNHVGNYGREALLETLSTLDRAGVAHSGAGKDITAAYAPTYCKEGGFTVGFCSFYSFLADFSANDIATEHEPGVAVARAYEVMVQGPAAYDTTNRDISPYVIQTKIAPRYRTLAPGYRDIALMKEAVKEAATKADFVFVSMHFHWALHGNSFLPPFQRVIAQELIDSGADLLIGHGPHTIRAVEVYKGKPIFYSAGNLVLRDEERNQLSEVEKALPVDTTHQGFVVRATVSRRSVKFAEVLPVSIQSNGAPILSAHDQALATVSRLSGLSATVDTEVQWNNGRGVVKLF